MRFREMTEKDIGFLKEHGLNKKFFHNQPEKIDFSYALEHENNLLSVGGIQLINFTTAWGWVELTEFAQEHIKTVYRVIKEWMNELIETYKIKRLQAYVEIDSKEGIRTIEHLGFKRESIMRNFVGNKSAYMYVRFME